MTHKILVPLDGSPLSEQAIPYAEALAKHTDADLMFMRAVLTATLAPAVNTFNQMLREGGREYLDMHVAAARQLGLRAEGHLWEDEAGYSILKMVETRSLDLIVMSTHGRSGLGRVVWGSVADYVLRHTPVPMLLIPRDVEARWTDMTRPRFVVPLDGSAFAEEALPAAEELARVFNGEIELVEVVEPSVWLIDAGDPWASYSFEPSVLEIEHQQTETATHYLDKLATTLSEKGIPVSLTVATGRAPSVIRQAAREGQACAIVMATHGRGGPSRMLMGSVTDAVVRFARMPVLVVRPSAVRQAAEPTQPAMISAERNLALALTHSELDLMRTALQHVINNARGGGDLVPAFDLMDRLNQVHGPEPSPLSARR